MPSSCVSDSMCGIMMRTCLAPCSTASDNIHHSVLYFLFISWRLIMRTTSFMPLRVMCVIVTPLHCIMINLVLIVSAILLLSVRMQNLLVSWLIMILPCVTGCRFVPRIRAIIVFAIGLVVLGTFRFNNRSLLFEGSLSFQSILQSDVLSFKCLNHNLVFIFILDGPVLDVIGF